MQASKLWASISFLALVAAVACGGGSEAPVTSTTPAPAAPAAPAAAPVDPATAGTLTGQVVLQGTPPQAEVIKMSADPVCMREVKGQQRTQFFIVGSDGGFDNVFVYVKDGLGNRTFAPPATPVTLDQQGCLYQPHVFGIQVGQPLEIMNSDPTLHNVHTQPTVNTEFNTGQPIQGMKFTHTFTAREVMVPFKCDVHGWMNAYAGVLDHPYFAVSAGGGNFNIATLPPGTYTIEAWHEKLGAQTQTVTIAEKETKEITFTFSVS